MSFRSPLTLTDFSSSLDDAAELGVVSLAWFTGCSIVVTFGSWEDYSVLLLFRLHTKDVQLQQRTRVMVSVSYKIGVGGALRQKTHNGE